LAAVPTRGGAWRIRLPVAVARPTYLMVSQGGLELALPWHAVLRLTMVPRGRFDSGLEALGLPVLAPYVALSAGVSELPLILVAHGLKRACLVADRLVWRLPAEPCAVPSDPRVPELGAVRTEDGSIHRVVGLEELLQSVPAIASPEAEFPAAEPERPLVDPRSEPSVAPTGGVALAEREPLAPAIVSEPRHLEETLPELEPARVLPLPLKALIAEDSITARHGLARLLERDGFEIEIAATAAEMELALERGGWALVLLDVELPDARGAALLDRARKRALAAAPGAAVVALVRDAEDEAEAHAAGIARWLRKPWNPEDVARLLAELGLGPTP
jgi:CheY-like chemotaxis protein